jgi:hypothetical protein
LKRTTYQLQPFAVRALGEDHHCVLQVFAQREGGLLQLDLAGFDLGEIENVVASCLSGATIRCMRFIALVSSIDTGFIGSRDG